MKKLVCVGCAVALTFCAKAAVFDLNGVDKEVTSLSEYPDGFTNTSDTQAKLTLVIGEDVTYAGPISGNLKLVKRGARDLTINTANTFTGGTEIYGGRLIVGQASALGTGEIYVENDCAQPVTYSDTSNLSALCLKCGSLTNDLRFSSWSAELPAVNNCQENYNLQSSYVSGWVRLYGKVTGGSISLDTSNQRTRNGNSWSNGSSFTVFMKALDCANGTVYMHARNVVQFQGQVKAKLLTTFAHDDYGHFVGFWPQNNDIKEYRIAGDNAISYGNNSWEHTVFVTTNYIGTGHVEYGSISMDNRNQTVDRLTRGVVQGTKNAWYPRRVYSKISNGVESMTALTFTMQATGDSECDYAFDNNITVKWAPKGDYKMTCVGDRINRTTGQLNVAGGTFEVTGTTTFSNVTAITVADGAKFIYSGTAAGAYRSVATVTVGAGAEADLGNVAAWTSGQIELTAAANAKITLPTDGDLEVLALTVGGVRQCVGTFDRASLPCLVGEGRITVRTGPATWTAGATPDDGIETAGNWSDPEHVAGHFRMGELDATFGSAGTRAVVSDKELFHGLSVNRTFTFEKGSEAAEVGVMEGGLTLSGAVTTTVEPPVLVGATQTWNVAAGHTLIVTGGLTQAAAAADKLTVKGPTSGVVNLYGRGEASTFAGPVDIKGCVSAVGDDPFGRAVDGVDGTVTLFGGNVGKLLLGKRGGPVTTITKPVVLNGNASRGYLQLASSDWHAGEAYMTRVTFLGPVDFNAGSTFDLNGFQPCVTFAGGGKMLSSVICSSGSMTVTNKPMELAFKNTGAVTLQLSLNVCSNRMDAFTPSGSANNLSFGADWALYEGNTELLVKYHWGNNKYYGSIIDLGGHSQRIGTLSSSIAIPSGATKSPFESNYGECKIASAMPATLYVNQTADKVMIIPFTGKVALCKEGAAKLMISNVVCTAQAPLTVAGGTLELFDTSWKNATNVTVTALEGDATLKLSTKLAAADVPANTFFTKKAFGLVMTDGEGTARLDLAEGVFETADTFVLNGKAMSGGCTYGSSASPADVKDDVHFAGKGVVRVAHPCGSILILR